MRTRLTQTPGRAWSYRWQRAGPFCLGSLCLMIHLRWKRKMIEHESSRCWLLTDTVVGKQQVLSSPTTGFTGLLGAELILRLSSWMLFASFMREGCRVKPRLPPGDEKRFLAQFSTDARDSSTVFFFLDGHSEVGFSKSETRVITFINVWNEEIIFKRITPITKIK